MKVILILFALFILYSCQAKNESQGTMDTFKVWGNCGMCEKTIEESLALEGVYMAEWDKITKMMLVNYDSLKYTNLKIQEIIAKTGYDTELVTGDNEAYAARPDCCLYERKQF